MASSPWLPEDNDPQFWSLQDPISAINDRSVGEEMIVMEEDNACSSKREMPQLSCRKGLPPTVQASKEKKVSSLRPSVSAESNKKIMSKSAQVQSE